MLFLPALNDADCDSSRQVPHTHPPSRYSVRLGWPLGALAKLEDQAQGTDLVLVSFAGHGVATEEGNILAPHVRA